MNIEGFKRIDKSLNKFMPFITPLGVVVALVLGPCFVGLKPLVNPLFGLMTFFGAMKISWRDMVASLKKPKFILVFALSSYIALPLVTKIVSLLFFNGEDAMGAGFILLRATPTAVVGSIWSGIYSGNMAVSLAILMLDTVLAPFLTPLLFRIFTGAVVEIDSSGMMMSLLAMVVIPFILGLVFNRFFNKEIKEYLGPISNPISKFLLLFIIVINVSQVSSRIIDEASWSYLKIGFFAFALAIIGFPVGHYLCKIFGLDRGETVSITFAVAMRNISASFVLAISFLPPSSSLPIIFSIVFQQTTAALMGHRYFGIEEKKRLKP